MSRGTHLRLWCVAAAALLFIAGLVGVFAASGGSGTTARALETKAPSGAVGRTLPRFRMDADHDVYPTVGEIAEATETIVIGQIVGHTTEPGESPGLDAVGDPLPAIPRTDHLVTVATVLKGAVSVGNAIHVVVAGGMTPEGDYVLEGAPQMNDGETALFFLANGEDGRFYPLAGGAAVAPRTGEGTFALPADATGGGTRIVSEGEVAAAIGTAVPTTSGGSPGDQAVASTGAALAVQKHHCARKAKKKAKHARKCVRHHHLKRHKHRKHRRHQRHASRGR